MSGNKDIKNRAISLGAKDFYHKNVSIEVLIEKIKNITSKMSKKNRLYKKKNSEVKEMVELEQNRQNKIKKNNLLRNCFGPIKNLEEYVHREWWNEIFNSFYLKTDGDVVDDQNITLKEVNFFSQVLQIRRDQHILDLCCGQGRHSLELAKRGFKFIEGLDRSRFLIHKAKVAAKRGGYPIKFREGDARKLPYPPDSFDVVLILGNSFGYFESIKDDLLVLTEVFRVLKPWGHLLIDIADGEYLKTHFLPRSWEWIDKNLFVCRERSLSLDKQRLISREIVSHVNKGVLVDQFYAERLYSRTMMYELLEKIGFINILFHGDFSPDSKRNQDLGMMQNRMIISALVKKKWTEIKRKKEEILKNIAVILGDPNKPDILKPLWVFDDDDFYTIDQLKNALLKLKGYNFIFLDNHDTLVQDLFRLKGKIDYIFNLCDEGYKNEAI